MITERTRCVFARLLSRAGHHRAFVLWHFANKRKMDPALNRAADSAHRVTHYSRKRAALNNPGQRIISRTRARNRALSSRDVARERFVFALGISIQFTPPFSRSPAEDSAVNITASPLCR